MNSSTNLSDATLLDLQRHRLEVLLDSPLGTAYRPSRIITAFKTVGQSLVSWLTAGSTPRISKYVQGEIEIWRVYDPVDKRTLRFDHEDALRTWLENRYYQ